MILAREVRARAHAGLGCEWARIKSFTDSASGIAELLCAEVSASPSQTSWRRAVAHGANAAARRGAGHGFETRRLAARNPSHRTAAGRHARRSRQLAVCAGVAPAVHGGHRRRARCRRRRCPPRLRRRPRRQRCRPRRRSRSTWCSAWRAARRCASPTRSCCRSCAALAATRATRWRPGSADWAPRTGGRAASTSATPRRRRCAPACASSSRRTSACERRCSGRG